MSLTTQKCVPCEVGGAPLTVEEVTFYMKDVPLWRVSEDYKKISRRWTYVNFVESMSFVNKIAALAEAEGHHPDIFVHYNEVTIDLWTHEVGGLSVNDFIVASKIDLIQ